MGRFLFICVLCSLVLKVAWATEKSIEVKGLFGGAAVLVIDGNEQLVRKGQETHDGVRLVEADAEKAVVEVNGRTRTLYLTDRIGTNFTAATRSQVHIQMTDNRQYLTAGSINGRTVTFLVDTGATAIAMNSTMARSLGVSLHEGTKIRVSTASATEQGTRVMLKEVQVGAIRVSNVQAVVIDGDHPREILLGMSFLQHVDISENNGLMVLTSRL